MQILSLLQASVSVSLRGVDDSLSLVGMFQRAEEMSKMHGARHTVAAIIIITTIVLL